MTLGELVANLLGWLGDFIQWVFGWVPRYHIVRWNERGVKYHRGLEPHELDNGLHWYVPNLDRMVNHWTSQCVLRVPSICVETKDGVAVEVGLVITFNITDVLQYEVENYDAEDSMDEVAQGMLRFLVTSMTWAEVCTPRLNLRLLRRAQASLGRFGVKVAGCRPADLVRLGTGAHRLFGVNILTEIQGKLTPGN